MSKRHRILVVDDDTNILDFLSMYLKSEGYDVLTALDGQQALSVIEREIPDLVLLDASILIKDDSVHSTVTEIPNKQVSVMIEFDTVKTVLAVFVVGYNCGQYMFVLQGIGYLNIFFIKPKAVHTTYQESGRIIYL